MKNLNLLNKLKEARSLYAVSHATGVPYTTLNRLSHGILDINRCSGDVIYRLSLYFGCTMEDLLNPVQLMTGSSGIYRNVKYRWEEKNGKTVLYITYDGKDHMLDEGDYSQKRFRQVYPAIGEILIDKFLSDIETEKMLNEK